MRIGDILLRHGWIAAHDLERAVSRPAAGKRLCSRLIEDGALAFDHAARALGEQRGVVAVLERHLAHRDRTVAAKLPADFARERVVLPIGRGGDGLLIVAARDPSPQLHDAIAWILGDTLVLAIAPASAIEHAIDEAYGAIEIPIDDDEDVAVDLEIDTDAAADLDAEVDVAIVAEVEAEDDEDLPVEVDDTPAKEDLELDIEVDAPAAPRRPANRALPVEIKPIAASGPATRDPLDVLIASCADIDSLDWLLDVVMAYVATRWATSLLLELRDRRAVGVRGHGRRLPPVAVRTFVLALEDTAIVRCARDQRGVVDEAPPELDTDDAQLVAALETDAWSATAIVREAAGGAEVSHVLVVGAPTSEDREDALVNLGILAEALGAALTRLAS